jgi:hypothetical protein
MEVTIAITIVAVAFLGIASVMGAAVKTLALQKARTQGNEVATQGIEDLQRYSYTNLLICGPPTTDTAPSDLSDPVVPTGTSSCPTTAAGSDTLATTKAKFGDFPCATTPPQTGIPRTQYSCLRINVTYNVRRYVAWVDAGHTAKRLAVYVDWTDQLGKHTVSQQSSLRSPATGDIVGIQAPGFVASTTASPNPQLTRHDNILDSGGYLTQANTLTVRTSGLTNYNNDRVFVSFTTLAANDDLTTSTIALAPNGPAASWDKVTWTGTLPSLGALRYPSGSQFLTFTAVRSNDGKTSSLVDTVAVSRFCPADGSGALVCPSGLPNIANDVSVQQSGTPQPPANTVYVDPSGALLKPITFTAHTTNLTAADSVSIQFLTKSGAFTTAMKADTFSSSCDASGGCTWTVQVLPTSGLSFATGTQRVLITAAQAASSRSTSAALSSDVTFSLLPSGSTL